MSMSERESLPFFCEVKTKMSERRPRVQSSEALNLDLLDPGSGTEPEIDFPDHDQDPRGDKPELP